MSVLPVAVDPTSKKISVDQSYIDSLPEESNKDLTEKLSQLNELSRYLVGLNSAVPPPPNNIAKNITDQVNKLKASGVAAAKAGKQKDALKFYSLAVELALRRPPWEATAYVIEEVCGVLGLRADAYMNQNLWPEAYTDASLIVLLMPNDAKGHYRKGRCLQTISKYAEARNEYQMVLGILPQDSAAKASLAEVEVLIAKS